MLYEVITLDTADSFLDFRGQGLHAEADAGDASGGHRVDEVRRQRARVDLNGDLKVCPVAECAAGMFDEFSEIFGRKRIGRAAAKVKLVV